MTTPTHGAPTPGAPTTKVARFVDASIAVRGVVIVALGDGASMRMTVQTLAELIATPFADRFIAYDVDSAGNRYNARVTNSSGNPVKSVSLSHITSEDQ